MMAAPRGNQYNKKLTTLELKQKVYDHYCEHLAKGKDKRRWFYESPDLTLTYAGLTNYLNSGS